MKYSYYECETFVRWVSQHEFPLDAPALSLCKFKFQTSVVHGGVC